MPSKTDSISLLDKVIRTSNSTVDIEYRLTSLLKILKKELRADRVWLFTMDRDKETLVLRSTDGRVHDQVGTLRIDLNDTFVGRAAALHRPIVIENEGSYDQGRPSQEYFKGYKTIAAFPVTDDQYLYGVLTLLNKNQEKYHPRRRQLLETISREMAGTIRNSRLYIESKKRIAELSVLFEVSKAVSSTIELDEILLNVVDISAKVLMAEGCALNVLDESTGRLRVASEYGNIPPECSFKHLLNKHGGLEDPALAACMSIRKPYIGPAFQNPHCACMKKAGGDRSLLCLPLNFKGQFKGSLCLYNKTGATSGQRLEFNNEDLELITTMGVMISSSLENAMTFQTVDELGQNNEALVQSLSSLYHISSAMMTRIKMDELLEVITRALIHRRGLGFDRALVFLMDEDDKNLVGAATAHITMENRKKEDLNLQKALNESASPSEEPSEWIAEIQDIHLPLTEVDDVMVRTALAKKASIHRDIGRNWVLGDKSDFGRHPFVSVPMMASGKVVGVFAVDRAYTQSPITPEDIRTLSMLANQAGLAIENSRLYTYIENVNRELSQARERLLESEKLAAMGEMAAGMAHEIRNPLVSIGGFTRRILKAINEEDSPIRSYIEVIIEEVTRLEKTLSDILDFSRDTQENYARYDLHEVIREALYLLKRDMEEYKIEVSRQFSPDLPSVYVDKRQIKHVFYNLFLNACQAMEKGGILTIKTYKTRVDDRPFIACDVTDTGPGIPPDLLPNIFNPFFTTKDTGAGLGLSIVHNILSRHQGEIDVFNKEGQGATFIVKLPAAEQEGEYLI